MPPFSSRVKAIFFVLFTVLRTFIKGYVCLPNSITYKMYVSEAKTNLLWGILDWSIDYTFIKEQVLPSIKQEAHFWHGYNLILNKLRDLQHIDHLVKIFYYRLFNINYDKSCLESNYQFSGIPTQQSTDWIQSDFQILLIITHITDAVIQKERSCLLVN